MTKIIVAIQSAQRIQARYEVFDASQVRIGRGFDNDLILSDSYISLNHLQITCDGENLTIEDLSSENGTYIVKAKEEAKGVYSIASGTELILGRTRIRIYLGTHKMCSTKLLMKSNRLVSALRKPVAALVLTLVMIVVSVFLARLQIITKEPAATYLIYPISALIFILLWAGFWSFIGRLIRHRIHFFVYISCYCVWYLMSNCLAVINDYTGFYVNNNLIYIIANYVMQGSLFIAILYFCLSFATNMQRKAKLIFSALFTILIACSLLGIKATIKEYYDYQTPYNVLLKPPLFGVKKGISIDRFIDSSESIFKFKEKG